MRDVLNAVPLEKRPGINATAHLQTDNTKEAEEVSEVDAVDNQ